MDIAKESVKKISLEEVVEMIKATQDAFESMKKDMEIIKQRIGFKDKTVGIPARKNFNDDPGPWPKAQKPAA